jgi:flagellar biosynthesis/type III secretory pathway M-ring protein FliF/YscJ
MFSKEVLALLTEVITSWQVIAITVALVIYLNIVFYVARAYHRPRAKLSEKIKFRKKAKPAAGGAEEAVTSGATDDLGLEES